MRLLMTLFCAGAFVLAGPAMADPCEHNGNGSPPFCDDEPGPPGHPGHGGHGHVDVDVDNTNTNTNSATASAGAEAFADANANATAFGGFAAAEGGSAEQSQGQSQSQGQETAVDASSEVIVEGDHVEALEADDLPGIPASIYVDACGNGLAAGFPGGSASFGAGNPVCLWLAIGRAANELGDRERADRALGEAEASLRRQRSVSRYLEGVPLIGRLF
jgi:hypothetical protein